MHGGSRPILVAAGLPRAEPQRQPRDDDPAVRQAKEERLLPRPRAHPGELREPGGRVGGHGKASAGGVVALTRVRERGGGVLEDAAQLQNEDDIRGAGFASCQVLQLTSPPKRVFSDF